MMLLSLLAVTLGLSASPLKIEEVVDDATTIVQTLQLRDYKIRIREFNDPSEVSPLVVRSTDGVCTIQLNRGLVAKAVWDDYLDDETGMTQQALRDFAVAHEVGHCMLAAMRRRKIELPALAQTVRVAKQAADTAGTDNNASRPVTEGQSSIPRALYDEAFADLFALRFLQMAFAPQYEKVRLHVREIRRTNGAHDTMHATEPFLTDANVAVIAKFLDRFATSNRPTLPNKATGLRTP